MKKTLLILIAFIAINTVAQEEIIYFKLDTVFRTNWITTTKKDAVFYRKFPLEKVGELYRIKETYMNGNTRMEGFWTKPEKEIYQGKFAFYYENGIKEKEMNYDNDMLNGISKTYFKDGTIKTEGIYKEGKPVAGTFEKCCPFKYVITYKEAKKIATHRYYKNTKVIAQKSLYGNEGFIDQVYSYNKKGEQIGYITQEEYESRQNGRFVYFDIDADKNIIGYTGISDFKNGKLHGLSEDYDDKGNLIAKGIYKEGKPFSGSFFTGYNYDFNELKTYEKGVLNGEEILYTKTYSKLFTGINKKGKRWSGKFHEVSSYYLHRITNYENGKITGEQINYYDTKFEKIAEISHIKNGIKEGEVISFNKEGKQLTKGDYKKGKQWNGSFYDFYSHQIKSFKKGIKHGVFINYSTKGKILSKQEFKEGKLSGKVKTTGYFENKECDCIYKKGEPYNGEVCNETSVITYEKGIITKRKQYSDDLETVESIIEYKEEKRYKETHFVKDKKYVLIYKGNRSYEGVQYNTYTNAFYTFKKGILEGPFSMSLGYSGIVVSGNYKNNKHHGTIKFEDSYANKKTTCTYDYGKPINGTVLTENGEQKYKDGLQYGKVIEVKYGYLYKKGERELIYNALEKEYKKGKIEGKVTYYKDDKIVNTNTYKNGKPYNGTFYVEQKFIEKYKKGVLQTVTANPHPYTITESYINNKITKVQATKGDNTYIGFYHLGNKYNGIFLNFDDKRFPLGYIKATYKDGFKNGLEKQYMIADDLKETLINTKTYKNGKIIKENWHNYYVNTTQNVQGTFKDEKPYNGHFYSIENSAFNISHYKEGIKEGKQFSGYVKEMSFVKTDSITYKNGKPFQGKKVTYKYNSKFLQYYENGEAVKTEILNDYGDAVEATVTYLDKGIITKNISGKIINEVIYLEETKEKAKVILYKDFKKVGTLEYDKDKITKLDLAFKEGGLDLKYYINKENRVTIKAKDKKSYILIYPNFKKSNNFTFIDFLNTEKLFMNRYYDGKADFYLNGIKKAIASCEIKKGKPFNGTIIRYNEKDNTYSYKKYKNGERDKKESDLTKKQLIKILK